MTLYFIALGIILSAQLFPAAASPPMEEIADLSNLTLLNPDLASRKTAKLRLTNGLEVLLISDSSADQSAAALAVAAGSWDDPEEYPGMAHFCEHMLFMGTKKFPNENEFFSQIADHNGMANAFTSSDRTVYMFSCSEDGFHQILDRFAHFFIDPLFNPSGINREMHAVDQEFSKNIENDAWREYMIFKETGNPDHPNAKFSTGNSQTLANIPQSALKKWHRAHYAADRMRLVLYSSASMETLKDRTLELFASVPTLNTKPFIDTSEISSPSQRGHITYIKPIKQRQVLTLSWELPREISLDHSYPAQLFAYALNRGNPYSLHEQLKREGLIDNSKIDVDDLGGDAHRFFQIQLQLTDKGLKELDKTILRTFQAINSHRISGIPEYLLEEMNTIAKLNYQFQPRQDAFHFVYEIGAGLLDGDLATYPRSKLLASNYEPQRVAEVGRHLTPDHCIFTLQADPEETHVLPDCRERWMGAEYAIREISPERLKIWRTAAPHPQIRLADPNPFLPSRLETISAPNDPKTTIPLQIMEDESGIAYYARVGEFQSPDAHIQLRLLTPQIQPTALSAVKTGLYLDQLTDELHPTLSTAASAGLQTSIALDKNRIQLKIAGFSDKASLLLQEILKELSLSPPTPEQFETYKKRHAQEFSNGEKDLAYLQAKELAQSLINQEKFTKKEKLAALETIDYEDYCTFLKTLFEEVYIQAMFCGNLTLKDAESAWLDVRHLLSSNPFPKENHPETKIMSLSSKGPFAIREKTNALGNSSFLLLDCGIFEFKKRAAQEILTAALKESFFTTLRTKQKTGYIAATDNLETELRLFQYFLVQSNSHQPEDLLYRFELFLESTLQELSDNINEKRFATLKQNLIQSLQTRFRNAKEKSMLWNQLAFDYNADFKWVEKRLDGFEMLSYQEFLDVAKSFLSRNNRKRLAILFEGKLNAPFAYELLESTNVGEVADYLTRPDLEKSY